MKSLRTDPRNHAAEGDERIRTAARSLGTSYTYVALAALDRLFHRLRIPHRFWWRICDAHDLALGVPDTPENFPRRHGYVRLQHIYTGASGYMDKATCSHCGRPISDPHPCVLALSEPSC